MIPFLLPLPSLLLFVLGFTRALKPLTEVFPSDGKTVVNLTVRSASVSVPLSDHGEGAVFVYLARLYSYKGVTSVPGPVIHVKAGGQLVLNLHNELGGQHYPPSSDKMYSYHGVNTTNVHFHGVHGDPAVDNIFRVAGPGETIQYILPIPKGHLPGLHWYHTHSHGSSYPLLMGGLFGALVVDGREDDPLASLPSVILMIHVYRLGPSTHCDGATMGSVDEAIGSNMSSQPRILNGAGVQVKLENDLFLVNGQHKPRVKVGRGEAHLLRMIFAAGSCYMNVSLPDVCQFHVVGIDGVPLRRSRVVKEHWLYFTTATRYDVIVQCNDSSKHTTTLRVFSLDTNETIFYIEVDKAQRAPNDKGLVFPVRYSLATADYLQTFGRVVARDISFSQLGLPSPKPFYVIGQGTDCSSLYNSTTCHYEHFMGEKGTRYRDYNSFIVPLNSVVEARVFGDPTDSMPHPLHLHVNHFRFVSFTPRKGGRHENMSMADFGVFPDDIRDTIPILDGVTIIRWRAATFTGEVVYHCHTLTHEDRGMMTSYLVHRLGGKEPNVDYLAEQLTPLQHDDNSYRIFLPLAIVFFFIFLLLCGVSWARTCPKGAQWTLCGQDITRSPRVCGSYATSEGERLPLSSNRW
ncbi:putative Multicopper oxidase [Trypanosoma vivax]|uniref:Plastocyanin-like domain-containing protein n=1 Tax=Trypanosoma vivax (strain Y486) TaxID=1055687 RepID=G0TSV2_TRYVY|nr:putative Multicopper oxidase [Trypanosoma vivax]CCC47031.1 conserved hypothetical protein [Trypanosoma vivax Y486]